jgi:hypothetical protein
MQPKKVRVGKKNTGVVRLFFATIKKQLQLLLTPAEKVDYQRMKNFYGN